MEYHGKAMYLLGITGLGGISHLFIFPVDVCKTILRLSCFSDEMHVRQGCWMLITLTRMFCNMLCRGKCVHYKVERYAVLNVNHPLIQ